MKRTLCLYFPAGIAAPALQGLAESAARYSSQLALRPGEALFVEVGRSRLLYSEATIVTRLKALAGRYAPPEGLPRGLRVGTGANAAEALAFARYPGLPLEALPMQALIDYASPFKSDEMVETQLQPAVAALADLGLHCFNDLLELPYQRIGERFGPDLALLRDRIEGNFSMAWPRFEKAERLEEMADLRAMDTQDGVHHIETIWFSLKQLADRAGKRLQGREERASRIRLELGLQHAGKRIFELVLALPYAAPLELFKLLRERLDAEIGRSPLGAPVATLRLSVTAMVPGYSAQRHFFDPREVEAEAWNSIISRLAQRLGDDQVFLAELVQRYLPERAWKRVIQEAEPAVAAAASEALPRPSRFLRAALPLQRHGDELQGRSKQWHALDWEGPERVSGEWWDDDFARDYWRVKTEEGGDLWVYEEVGAAADQVWLQGYFD